MKPHLLLPGVLAPLLLIGACSDLPLVLDPHGSNAQQTARIAWVLFGGGAIIFVLVAMLAAFAVFAPVAGRAWLRHPRFVVVAGIVFPIVALSALLVYTLAVSGELARSRVAAPLRIAVTGETWWWRVRYLDARGETVLETANEMHIPVGQAVELSLDTADVLHSFWVPSLSGKLDMIPGRVNVLRLTADTPGTYRGQCAEFCGAQHAKMAFHVVAREGPDFDLWLAARRMPAAAPQTPDPEQGMTLFIAHCAACHTVRGTPAAGRLGPDLTHVGSRLTLAAGTLPNNAGTFAGWIAGSQHIKPGNRMPSFDRFSGEELVALAEWLESLR